MKNQRREFRVHFEKGATREETLLGRDYLVVPCIAMVEGVRFGAGQTMPELGLASEFGETPITWANRPLVLNHPQVDGSFVSANTPGILDIYAFGMTMNPYVEDGKLHLEAWIDVQRASNPDLGFSDTYDRIVAQEDVEVSVGFFSDIEEKKGRFNGQVYGAIWRNIKPDHLAVLTEGTIGACSVEDGCGIPRVNLEGKEMAKDATLVTNKNSNTQTETTGTPKAQCSCGGTHTQEEHTDEEDAPVTQKGLKSMLADLLKPFTQSKEEKALEAHIASGKRAAHEILVNQSIDPALMDRDVRALISRALQKEYGNYTYLLGYTQEVAVYEAYNPGMSSYLCYQVGIDVTDSAVKFVGEPAEVILQTKIVPQADATGENTTVVNTQENDMADDKTKTTPTANATADTPTTEKKIPTAQEYIDNAPPEIREVMQSAMKAQADQKNAHITTLKANKANKFGEDELKAMSLDMLDKLVSLLPADRTGLAPATQNRFQAANGGSGDTVPVVKAFGKKVETKSDAA